MAKFAITGARQELGFTPTRAVRANIDVRTGDVGSAIGQGVVQLAGQAIRAKKRQDEDRRRIEEKRRQMQDANSAVIATKLRDTATIEFGTFKLTNPQETWEQFRIKQAGDVAIQIGELDFSPAAAETQRLKSEAYTSVETAKSLTQATRQLREDTVAALTEAMVDAFRSGDVAKIAEASRRFSDNGANMGKDKAEVLSDIKTAKEVGGKLRKQKDISLTAGAAFIAWQETVTPSNPKGDLNVGFALIEASDIPASDKQKAESELQTRVTNRRAERKIQLEAAQEQSRDAINKAIFEDKDYSVANTLIANSPLSETEQKTLFSLSSQRASAAAKGVPLKNDRVVESEMYDLSLGIWKGNITKTEFDAQLLKVGDKLDDGAWNRLTASASNTLKTSQAESLTRASTAAKNVLVDFKSEDAFARFISDSIKGLEPDIAKAFEDDAVERRQLQFNSLTQYDNETREWIADNPDKVGKDFFQFSESLKHEYWNRNIDELRKLREERDREVKVPLDELKPGGPLSPPTIKTQAEYDALPSGTEYIDANGARGTKR